jgi:hypothetical protein
MVPDGVALRAAPPKQGYCQATRRPGAVGWDMGPLVCARWHRRLTGGYSASRPRSISDAQVVEVTEGTEHNSQGCRALSR